MNSSTKPMRVTNYYTPRPTSASFEFMVIADALELSFDLANNAIFTEAEAEWLIAQLDALVVPVLKG